MLELKIEDLGIDDPIYVGESWYAFASFYLATRKKIFGLPIGYERLGHRINLLICSPITKVKPDDPYISEELFGKCMTLTDFQVDRIKEYIEQKVGQASSESSLSAAFDKLETSFEIED